ncbi:MAG: hypothetical protein ISS93_01775 [Candidatus Aenigmarchaeota archaeon]|nr:hypothetical protein [Candidatus Aenigmarchaeota archaeon]
MVKYLEALKKGIVFGVNPVRWGPVFALDAVFFVLLVNLVFGAVSLQGLLGGAAVLAVIWFLLRVWVTGALIHQTWRESETGKSWRVPYQRYLSILLVMIIVIFINIIVGMVPLINMLLIILVGVAVFFSLQAVVIRKRNSVDALRESYSLFRKRMDRIVLWDNKFLGWVLIVAAMLCISVAFVSVFSYAILGVVGGWIIFSFLAFMLFYSKVFRAWVAVSIVAGAISGLFAAPGLLWAFSSTMANAHFFGGAAPLLSLLANPHLLMLGGIVFIIGSSIATAFSLKAQTEFYLQLRKKRFGLF